MIYLAGSGPFIFTTPLDGGTYYTTGVGDAAWTTTGLGVANTGATARTKSFGPLTEGWVHFMAQYAGRGWNNNFVACLYNAAGTPLVRIYAQTFQVWNGAAWLSNGSLPVGGGGDYDIYFKAHATEGRVELYFNKELVGFFAGDTSNISVDHVRFGNPITFGGDQAYYSQILVADFPTLFAKVKQTLFTGQGTHTAWSGNFNDIKDAIPDVNTTISTPTPDAKESFIAAERDFTGYTVRGVIAQFAGLRGGTSSPSQVRALVRVAGVDYFGQAQNMGYGRTEVTTMFETNPATGVAWTAAEAGSAALEVGVQAKA